MSRKVLTSRESKPLYLDARYPSFLRDMRRVN